MAIRSPTRWCLSPSEQDGGGDQDEAAKEQLSVGARRAHIDEINASLNQHEQLEKLVVVTDDWTIENGLLTPTMKLKRSAIETKYGDLAPTWYDQKQPVVWA